MTTLMAPPPSWTRTWTTPVPRSPARSAGRTDGKASLLLAFTGAVLALGAAAVLLLLVVRPRLRGHDRASFRYWARLDDDETIAGMQGGTRAARIRAMSGIAVGKFRPAAVRGRPEPGGSGPCCWPPPAA